MVQGPPATGDPDPAVNESSTDFECRADAEDSSAYPPFSPQASAHVPFQCLEFADAAGFEAKYHDYHIVDIEASDDGVGTSAGILRIALHEIKTKAFLRGRKVAIVSNGKRFGAMERECKAIRGSGVEDVVALLNTGPVTGERAIISAREYVGERPYGIWRVENRTSNAEFSSALLVDTAGIEPLLARQQQRNRSSGPVRTLVVLDGEADGRPLGDSRATNIGYSFVLEGGLDGLRQFETEATAMARAQARPRIGERGCRG